ncbi:metal ABC transporter solute-binding protein, Zn/Mn family [Cytobacillus sp. IB215316]|uniref:metal ABC transporter solute-binding protein, Zn/Mn family n=1 Tax=Cytobacillus sp. IB215316 TaxID=3097354 RepID=UPI002A0AED07|nr:zinc ABC transporter substrate-binding protein [Cytobacillus sp. IB215316]MDX8361915.1 zinc ABC transporter substrate-binding protein [Cytobacillus sp. IB215316]
MKINKSFYTLVFAMSLILAGCGNSETVKTGISENEKITIYTTIYPLEDFAKKIGEDYVDVKSIYPPNVDAHSFEPSAKDMVALAKSDLFIYSGVGIDAFAENAIKSLKNESVTILEAGEGIELLESSQNEEHLHEEVDADAEEHGHEEQNTDAEEHGHEEQDADAEEHGHEEQNTNAEEHGHEDESIEVDEDDHNHGDYDPHIWLDPLRAIELAENIKNKLSELKPEHASIFESNYIQLKENLEKLDEEFKSTIESSKTDIILVSHAAYGYWEARYGIEQIAITGLSPTQEPSLKQLQNIIEESKEHDLHYVIFEQSVTPKVVKTIQKELGAESLTLHNLESLTEENIKQGDDYFSIMRMNLHTIKTALND